MSTDSYLTARRVPRGRAQRANGGTISFEPSNSPAYLLFTKPSYLTQHKPATFVPTQLGWTFKNENEAVDDQSNIGTLVRREEGHFYLFHTLYPSNSYSSSPKGSRHEKITACLNSRRSGSWSRANRFGHRPRTLPPRGTGGRIARSRCDPNSRNRRRPLTSSNKCGRGADSMSVRSATQKKLADAAQPLFASLNDLSKSAVSPRK
jgi:hypothetical protein